MSPVLIEPSLGLCCEVVLGFCWLRGFAFAGTVGGFDFTFGGAAAAAGFAALLAAADGAGGAGGAGVFFSATGTGFLAPARGAAGGIPGGSGFLASVGSVGGSGALVSRNAGFGKVQVKCSGEILLICLSKTLSHQFRHGEIDFCSPVGGKIEMLSLVASCAGSYWKPPLALAQIF